MVSKKGEIFMEIKREDIPDNMINMLEIVGMENFLKIIKEYGGDALYIPYYKSLKKKARNREIRKAYNGFIKNIWFVCKSNYKNNKRRL